MRSNYSCRIMLGAVIFYEPNYEIQTIKELARTPVIDYSVALELYCETPNPASQMAKGETIEEVESQLKIIERNAQNPYWLICLFDSI